MANRTRAVLSLVGRVGPAGGRGRAADPERGDMEATYSLRDQGSQQEDSRGALHLATW